MPDGDEVKVGPLSWIVIAFLVAVMFGVIVGQMTDWW